jgi:hypothetical protein
VTVLNWPAELLPQRTVWSPLPRTSYQASPTTGTEVTQERQGGRWGCTLTFDPLEPDEWLELEGLMGAMFSAADYVLLPRFEYPGMRGLAAGTLHGSGNADSKTLNVTGITPSTLASAFRRGDLITASQRLYRVTADADAASGNAALAVWPPLRSTLSAAALTVDAPVCLMRLKDDAQGPGQFTPPQLGAFTIDFIEPLS